MGFASRSSSLAAKRRRGPIIVALAIAVATAFPVGAGAQEPPIACSPEPWHCDTGPMEPGVPSKEVDPVVSDADREYDEGAVPIIETGIAGTGRSGAQAGSYRQAYERRAVCDWCVARLYDYHSYDLNATNYTGRGTIYVCALLRGKHSRKQYTYDCGNNSAHHRQL